MKVLQYGVIATLQLSLMLIDIIINTASEHFRSSELHLLVMYIVQDVSLVLALIILFLVFFNTYVFKAGLVALLIRKFVATIVVTLIYLALCLALHVWAMKLRWGKDKTFYIWDAGKDGYLILYVCQRAGSVLYYFFYKRTTLRLGDPNYYKDSAWLREHVN
ncbi:transmembrane protein 138-like [Bolinopsis microptera]|uniref:transmembrane protein 138-like n=1 Tax=Bolinopsis microptera TaxID=2820187 RepID=UPI00307A1826